VEGVVENGDGGVKFESINELVGKKESEKEVLKTKTQAK